MIHKLEYIWLDGYGDEPNLRSKTKVLTSDTEPTLESLPIWNFDGSSTKQAEGKFSDCLLKPVKMIKDPQRKSAYLVLCEVLNSDSTPFHTFIIFYPILLRLLNANLIFIYPTFDRHIIET